VLGVAHAAFAWRLGKWISLSLKEALMTRLPKAVTRQRREPGIFETSPYTWRRWRRRLTWGLRFVWSVWTHLRRGQLLAKVAIGEAVDRVLAAQEGTKELTGR
jgi:hypothetical protein